MQVAVAALEEEGATVAQLADRLGYRSEAAFSRAFKRVIGVSPGAIRRSAGGDFIHKVPDVEGEQVVATGVSS
jgi:AraC-like DNA-binding protein